MGFNGTEVQTSSTVAQWLAKDGLGGVLLFDKDVKSGLYQKNLKNPDQIKELIHQLHYYSRLSAGSEQLLVAIDYEGGAVDRLSRIEGCMPTMKASAMALLTDEELNVTFQNMAITLQELGFNLNFAPVVDLNLNEQAGIIGSLGRSFSANPNEVARLASKFVEVFSNYGIACCYKHFPGHGSATGDTHAGFVDVTETFNEHELTPYRQLLHHHKQPVMIMTAHVINRHLDATGTPATLSPAILTDLLRHTMAFDGVIISDDLQMHAIAQHYSLEDSLCKSINAGADMLIFANQLDWIDAPEVINCIEALVMQNKISMERINEAYRRITQLKKQIKQQVSNSMQQTAAFGAS